MARPLDRGIVLGLVGPVCAGKSEVCRRLRQLGADVYEADQVVRDLYQVPEVKAEIRALFGDQVFDTNGSVSRPAIAERVFGPNADPELLGKLTQGVIFPRSGRALEARLSQFRTTAGPTDVLVVDAPTLFEAGRESWCDRILLVTAPGQRRRQWAASRGLSATELTRRDEAMLPEAVKRQRADYVIENAGTIGDLHQAADELWSRLIAS